MLADDRVDPLLDRVEAALLGVDADFRLTYCNRYAERLFGWSAAEALGRDPFELLLVDEADRGAAEAILRLLREGRSWEGEFPIRHRDGRTVVVYWRSTPVLDNGRFTGAASAGIDITERHRVEQERALRLEIERAAREQLEASERRLSFLLEASEAMSVARTLPEAFGALARLAVGQLADLCFIDVYEGERLARMAAVHVDPARQPLVAELERYPPDPHGQHPVARAVRTGETLWENHKPAEFFRQTTRTAEHFELVMKIGLSSYVCVPLRGRARVFGALTLVRMSESPGYTPSEVRLAEDLGRRAALAIEATRESEERRAIARQLQRSLLPPVLPTFADYEIGARYVAAGEGLEVGGDFYDVFATAAGWAVAIGDVCGRGAEAAAVTGLVRHTIRALALHETRPDCVLEQLNRVLVSEAFEDRFVTVCLLLLSGPNREFAFASGGHPPPVIVRAAGNVEIVGAPGDLLGIHDDVQIPIRASSLHPGDALVLYTDGVTERREGSRIFGERGLLELLERVRGLPAQAIADAIADAVAAFQPNPGLDDMAVLVVRALAEQPGRAGDRTRGQPAPVGVDVGPAPPPPSS